ncbi:MAG: acyl-CoA thioesterase [Bdellovibrionales bacterium]|nr:acyl-CoA thioesterase [Bdellovibrionales bacterium]
MSSAKLRFTAAFDDSDSEGIVFFGNYFRLAHRALEQWLPAQGISWEEWFKNPAFGVPLRHAEADYLKPLKPGQTFEVTVRVAELGESSVHFEIEFQTLDGTALARLKTSHVFVSREGMKKIGIPEAIRARLQHV